MARLKLKKPKDGRMKKAKCRDGIAQRGKTRGKNEIMAHVVQPKAPNLVLPPK